MRGHTSYLTFATLRPQHVAVAAKPVSTPTLTAAEAPAAEAPAQAQP